MHPCCKSYSNIKLANLWHPNLTTGIFIVPLAIRMHNISFKSTISGANDVSIIKTKVALLRYIFLRLLLIFHFGKVVSFFVLFTHTKLLQIKLSCPVLPYPVLSFPFLYFLVISCPFLTFPVLTCFSCPFLFSPVVYPRWFFRPYSKAKVEKLRPSKAKQKVKLKFWYFVFKYSVGISRHRLLKGPSRNNLLQIFKPFWTLNKHALWSF